MAGHSHWKNIKRKKEAADKKKSQLYTKAAHKIIAALRKGDANPETNYELKIALEYAKQVKMPKENIDRLIKKYKEGGVAETYQTIFYEVLGPSNVPMLIKVLTDNSNRTLTELRTVLRKKGAKLVEKGALAWQFEEKGKIVVALEEGNEHEATILEILDLIEADDIQEIDGGLLILVNKENLSDFTNSLVKSGFKVIESEVDYKYVGAPMHNIDYKVLQTLIEELKRNIPDIEDIWTIPYTVN